MVSSIKGGLSNSDLFQSPIVLNQELDGINESLFFSVLNPVVIIDNGS